MLLSAPLTSADKQGESHPRWLQTSHAAAAIQQPQRAPGRVTRNKSQTIFQNYGLNYALLPLHDPLTSLSKFSFWLEIDLLPIGSPEIFI